MSEGVVTIYIMFPRNSGELLHPKSAHSLSDVVRYELDSMPDYEGNKKLVADIQKTNPEVTEATVDVFLDNNLDTILKLDYEFAQKVHLYDILENEVFNIEPYGKGLLEFLNDCEIMFYVVGRRWFGRNEIELSLEPFHMDYRFSISTFIDKISG